MYGKKENENERRDHTYRSISPSSALAYIKSSLGSIIVFQTFFFLVIIVLLNNKKMCALSNKSNAQVLIFAQLLPSTDKLN